MGADTVAGRPGFMHGLVIVALAWVGPAAGVVIAPILPTLVQVFRADPHVDVKIALVATGPALLVALSSLTYGFLLDHFGRRRILIAALIYYGLAGTAPFLLDSLDWIVATRLAVGLGEGAVITAGTALIADYFTGAERERWMAAQTGAAPLAAVGLVVLGGALGAIDWHAPFLIYTGGWLLVLPVFMLIFEPAESAAQSGQAPAPPTDFKWTQSIWISIALALSMLCFMIPIIQFSFLATERGMTSPSTIGLFSALVTLGNPLGSLIFVFLPFLSAPRKLVIAYVLFAAGFLLMGAVATTAAAIVGSLLANIGAGIMFPALATWLLATLPAAVRGRGSGLFTTATFLGQFASPLVILGCQRLTGSLSHAVFTVGCVCAVVAAVAGYRSFGTRISPAAAAAGARRG